MKFASQLSIQSKLMVMLLTVSIASILVIGFVGYQGGREALMQNLSAQMSQLRITRTRQIVDYFTDLQNQVVTLAEDPSLMAATIAFQTTFNQLDDQLKNPQPDTQLNNQPDQPNLSPQELSQLWLFYQQSFIPRLAENVEGTPTVKPYFPKSAIARYLQYHYIAANSYPVESKSRLENPEDGSEYSKIHRQFHPFLRDLSERFQYQNLMLIDSKTGNVIYEVAKQVGFATSVTQDSFVNSGVAALFKTLKDRGEPRTFAVADFNPFRPNAGKPAAFVGAPVFREGNLTGILVLQLPVDQINRIMTGNSQWPADGLGQTGETVLVGPDLLLRSPSRFLMEEPEGYFQDLKAQNVSPRTLSQIRTSNSPVLLQEFSSPVVEQALEGETGIQIAPDYRGVPALMSYGPLKLNDQLNWATIAKTDINEVFAPIRRFRRRVLTTAAILVPLVTFLSLFLSRSVVKPIEQLIAGTEQVARGDTEVMVTVNSGDEFHQLANSFNHMTHNLHLQKQMLEDTIQENTDLILKILPASIADRLKHQQQPIADQFMNVTVIYAELMGFNHLCTHLSAQEILLLLNQLVSAIDEAAERYGVEKIRTCGAVYTAASGLFTPRLSHTKDGVDFALEILQIVSLFRREHQQDFAARIGVNSGPVTAGLVGRSKYVYDLWGEVPYLARLLAAEGKVDTILVTQTVYDRLHELYEFNSLGDWDTRQRGMIPVWSLRG